jgi:hypothetical protein
MVKLSSPFLQTTGFITISFICDIVIIDIKINNIIFNIIIERSSVENRDCFNLCDQLIHKTKFVKLFDLFHFRVTFLSVFLNF